MATMIKHKVDKINDRTRIINTMMICSSIHVFCSSLRCERGQGGVAREADAHRAVEAEVWDGAAVARTLGAEDEPAAQTRKRQVTNL